MVLAEQWSPQSRRPTLPLQPCRAEGTLPPSGRHHGHRSREEDVVGQQQRQLQRLPVPRLPTHGQPLWRSHGYAAAFRQPGGTPFPQQDHLHLGLPIHTLRTHQSRGEAREERQHHVLLHRVRSRVAHRRQPARSLLPHGYGGLEPPDGQHLHVGLCGAVPQLLESIPQPSRSPTQPPVLPQERRTHDVRAGHGCRQRHLVDGHPLLYACQAAVEC